MEKQEIDIEMVRKLMDQLELLDNSYFQKDRGTKMREVHDRIMEQLSDDLLQTEIEDKKKKRNLQAQYFYFKGKTLDFIPEFQKEAEEFLAKAVKLKPTWNEPMRALAHVYWK